MMMKRVLLGFALLLAASPARGAAKSVDYSGAWKLDMVLSKNLPTFYGNVKSHRLRVSQDWGYLNVEVEVDDGGAEPFKTSFGYRLDGTETKTKTRVRTPSGVRAVPTTLKAVVTEGGDLHITVTRQMRMGEGAFNATTVEDWHLGADGKTLDIRRADDTPRGKMESEMVFVRG